MLSTNSVRPGSFTITKGSIMFSISRRRAMNALACVAFLSVAPTASFAAEVASKDEAVAMVKKAISFYQSNGKDKLAAEINGKNPMFIDRDLYIYVITMEGVVVGHATNQKLVDKNLAQLKDADGKPFVEEILALAKDKKAGWVDYKWPNPVTKKVDSKTTYTEFADGLVFCAGVYR